MSVAASIRSMFSRLPQQVTLYITSRCNYRCSMCFYWRHLQGRHDELETWEWQRVAAKMWHCHIIYISGGEPFLRPDLAVIASAFAEKARILHVFTNGSVPRRIERTVAEILDRTTDTSVKISLSLDGIGWRHDRIRGFPGAWDRFLETHDRLVATRKQQPRLTLNAVTTLSAFNIDVIGELVEFVRQRLDVDSHGLNLVRGSTTDPEAGQVSPDAYRDAVSLVSRPMGHHACGFEQRARQAVKSTMYEIIQQTLETDRMVLPCSAGRRLIVVDESGRVFPCDVLEETIGTLRDVAYDLRRAVNGKVASEARHRIRGERCYCTHECYVQGNIVRSPRLYPGLLARMCRSR